MQKQLTNQQLMESIMGMPGQPHQQESGDGGRYV